MTGQPSPALTDFFFFLLKELYPKINSGTLAACARLDSFKNGGKKESKCTQLEFKFKFVIKAGVRRVATLLSVSVFFFFFFFFFFLFTEVLQSFLVRVGGTRTSPLPVRTELQ